MELKRNPAYGWLLEMIDGLKVKLEKSMCHAETMDERVIAMMQWGVVREIVRVMKEKPEAAEAEMGAFLQKNPHLGGSFVGRLLPNRDIKI